MILTRADEITLVQCEAYSKNIGVSAVRELQGVRANWPEARRAMLVELYGFSKAAREFAAQHGIELFSVAHDHLRTDYRPPAS